MRLKKEGDAPEFKLKDMNGNIYALENKREKPILLSFYRYASCPLCNLRIHNLISNYDEYSKEFDVVAVFQSSQELISKYVGKQSIPFPLLADPEQNIYKKYGVEVSWVGFFKAWILRVPTILNAITKGFLPGSMQGHAHRIPADFLIGTDNKIIYAFYGKDIGDHISIDTIYKELRNE